MSRHESEFKQKIMLRVKERLPGYIAFRLEDKSLSGLPDIVLNGGNRTSWWEVKHGDPHFDSKGIQELTMLRLAVASTARYIIFLESAEGGGKQTLIVHPKNIKTLLADSFCVGHDINWVVEQMLGKHLV